MDDLPVRRPDRGFKDLMTRGEHIAVGIYFPLHVVAWPLLFSYVGAGLELDDVTLNAVYYSVGAIYMLSFLHKYLRRSFDVLLDAPGQCLRALLIGLAADYSLSLVVSMLLLLIQGGVGTTANNEAVSLIASEGFNRMFAIAVILAPIVEEPIFRGFLFGAVRKKSRVAAYIVSVVCFALYHVWQYVAVFADWRYLLDAISYIPVSVALAYSYERSGCIYVPMVFHILINFLSMSLLA